jgi:predicted flap endonuclease-1-like 5' DNA nuclease
MTPLQLFIQNVTEGPGSEDSISHLLEIIIMLSVAFILGYLLRMMITSKYKAQARQFAKELEYERSREKVNLDETRNFSAMETKLVLLEQKNNALKLQVGSLDSTKIQLQGAQQKNREQEIQLQNLKEKLTAQPEVKLVAKKKAIPTKPVTKPASKVEETQLSRIEGIGPKIQEILHSGKVFNFKDLAESTPSKLRDILLAEGPQYKVHDPETWPEQAAMAEAGKWDELLKWQATLKGGKKN